MAANVPVQNVAAGGNVAQYRFLYAANWNGTWPCGKERGRERHWEEYLQLNPADADVLRHWAHCAQCWSAPQKNWVSGRRLRPDEVVARNRAGVPAGTYDRQSWRLATRQNAKHMVAKAIVADGRNKIPETWEDEDVDEGLDGATVVTLRACRAVEAALAPHMIGQVRFGGQAVRVVAVAAKERFESVLVGGGRPGAAVDEAFKVVQKGLEDELVRSYEARYQY